MTSPLQVIFRDLYPPFKKGWGFKLYNWDTYYLLMFIAPCGRVKKYPLSNIFYTIKGLTKCSKLYKCKESA